MRDAFRQEITEAARRRATKHGKVLTDSDIFDGHISSNADKDSQQKTVFLLTEMFQLELSTKGALGIDNQHSLATIATRVSNTTQEMSQAAANTPFSVNAIKDDDVIAVTSGVTTATAFSSPRNLTESDHSITLKSTTAKPHSFGGGQTSK